MISLMESCPRCRIQLHNLQIAGRSLEECAGCGGLRVKIPDFRHLCSDIDAQADIMAVKPEAPPPAEKRVEYFHCPTCGNLMNRMRYARGANVITHICVGHGIWLQLPALQEIILFIRAGGLERARRRNKEEQDRKREMEYLTGLLNVCTGTGGPPML
jgi:Zn-finger nucleic acid-binding protein